MVEKVEITDPYKVDPTLKGKSVRQLEDEITLRKMALDEMRKEEEAAERKKLVEEAALHVENILEGLKFLKEKEFLPESIQEFFTTPKGLFLPHLKLKPPRS